MFLSHNKSFLLFFALFASAAALHAVESTPVKFSAQVVPSTHQILQIAVLKQDADQERGAQWYVQRLYPSNFVFSNLIPVKITLTNSAQEVVMIEQDPQHVLAWLHGKDAVKYWRAGSHKTAILGFFGYLTGIGVLLFGVAKSSNLIVAAGGCLGVGSLVSVVYFTRLKCAVPEHGEQALAELKNNKDSALKNFSALAALYAHAALKLEDLQFNDKPIMLAPGQTVEKYLFLKADPIKTTHDIHVIYKNQAGEVLGQGACTVQGVKK